MWWVPQVSRAVLRAGVRPSTQLLSGAQRCYSTSVKLPPDIAYEELKQKLVDKQVTLIDVRMPGEHRRDGMIPNSKNLALPWLGPAILQPDKEFASQIGFNKPALDEPIAVTCLAGVRARTGQLALMAAGYTNVRVYVGSLEDWIEKGGELEFPKEKQDD